MEEGVYYNKTVQENLEQFTFIKIKKIGIAYGRKLFSLDRIVLTFANPELIFPALKDTTDKDKGDGYSPLVINNDNLLKALDLQKALLCIIIMQIISRSVTFLSDL